MTRFDSEQLVAILMPIDSRLAIGLMRRVFASLRTCRCFVAVVVVVVA